MKKKNIARKVGEISRKEQFDTPSEFIVYKELKDITLKLNKDFDNVFILHMPDAHGAGRTNK